MNILLTAHGSRGDVYPMLALGREFVRHGHKVRILTEPNYRKRVADAGLEGLFTSEDIREEMTNMGSDWRSVRRMMEWSRKSLDEEFSLLDEVSGDSDLVVSTNQEFSVASIAEWRNIPAYRLSYMPAIPGDHTPPLIPWQNLPVRLNRLIWKGFGAGLDSLAKKTVNDWRTSHALPPVKSLTPHMTSVYHTFYGFNSRLAPPHPSWDAKSYSYSGYCFEEHDGEELPPDLEIFLETGKAPVYLGFGSVTVPDPDAMTRIALEASMKADCRLIIGRGWTGLGSSAVLSERQGWATPDRVCVVEEVSHTRLFPRIAGACHHGGSGTTHRAARAGIPQFIMPLFIDQHFWGDRIYRSEVGPKPVPPKKLTAEIMAGVFRKMDQGDIWRDAATELAESVKSDEGTPGVYQNIMKRSSARVSGAA